MDASGSLCPCVQMRPEMPSEHISCELEMTYVLCPRVQRENGEGKMIDIDALFRDDPEPPKVAGKPDEAARGICRQAKGP